jgi:hypothetical protein
MPFWPSIFRWAKPISSVARSQASSRPMEKQFQKLGKDCRTTMQPFHTTTWQNGG